MNQVILRRFLAYGIGFILILNIFMPAQAQYFHFESRRKKISFSFEIVKNLMIIPVMINGKGPFNFILDTGVGILLITDPALLDTLHLSTERSIKIAGFGEGSDLNADISSPFRISIASALSGSMRAAVLQKEAFNLSGLTGMPIYGIIGYELFSSFIVRVRYPAKTITLYRNETAYIPRRGYKIPITIEDNKPYIEGNLHLNNDTVMLAKFIIDTGAGHPVSLETTDKMPFQLPEEHISANLGVGLSGEISGFVARVPSLKLGRYTLKNVIASFPDYSDAAAKVIVVNRNGNIGNGILKRFDVVFDYSRSRLFLRPNSVFKKPFEHDMSGMEFISFGKDYEQIMITRIEKGSAAAEAGLMEGDEILAINMRPVKEMDAGDIDELLRSQDGKSLLLKIKLKDSETISHFVLTLKRRI